MLVAFLCGCRHTITDSGFHSDDDGMLTCPIHGHRRCGWRSIGRHHERSRWTELQVERFEIFGEEPVFAEVKVTAGVVDTRDNRDPEAVWKKQLHDRSWPMLKNGDSVTIHHEGTV